MLNPDADRSARGRPRNVDLDARILDGARAILASDGYAAVTVSAVARHVGLPRSTVYRRYPSVVALRYAASTVPPAGLSPLAESGDVRTDMAAHIAGNASMFRSKAGRSLLRSLLADALADAEGRRMINERLIGPRLDHVVGVLERARERGDLPDTVDSRTAAMAITGTLIYRVLLLDEDADDALLASLLDLLFPPR